MTRRLSLDLEGWPEADRRMWAALFRKGGPLDEAGPLSHLRGASRRTLQDHYAKWLGWLQEREPDLLDISPVDRVSVARLIAWMADRPDYAPMSRLMLSGAVLRVVEAAAPTRDWELARRLCRDLQRKARRNHGERKRGRILSSRVLFDAGRNAAGMPIAMDETPLAFAKRRRDGALIAFLALIPMRAQAVCELALGTSLQVTPDAIRIALDGDTTKNGQPWEAAVPRALEPLLRDYLDETRPWLMGRRGARHADCWVNDKGDPFRPGQLGVRVRAITERLLGVRVSPHFFRDAAATTLARRSPADARLIRPLLGHLNFEVAEQHYIQAKRIEAGRDYARVLQGLKNRSRP